MSKSNSLRASELNENELMSEISDLVNSLTGVQLGEKQKTMVKSRVQKRISSLGLKSERDYADYLRAHPESETAHLVSLLTTHHTYFFREFAHFEHLESQLLPALIEQKRKTGMKKISVWSAACSTGQEAYSLAMFLDHYFSKHAPDFTFEIFGTDVDPASVKTASNGVYRAKEIQEIPLQFLARHWARGTGDISAFVKVKPSLKERCRFEPMNLLQPSGYATTTKFDVIFCRNVFIYFNADQIKAITSNLLNLLRPEGALYLGVSESLNGLGLPCQVVGPSIYSHPKTEIETKAKTSGPSPAKGAPALSVVPKAKEPKVDRPLRVLCVDDSPTILALLRKILVADAGFEVVGTAGSGLEAAEKMKTLKVDLMTLDIHMPQQTGLEYLKANFRKGHPPVVMITSVSREDASLPLECLKAGATDYIEKPSLSNLVTQTDEIRMKLKYAVKNSGQQEGHDLVGAFAKKETIQKPEQKLRLVFGSLADRGRVGAFLKDLEGTQPVTLVVAENLGSGGPAMSEALSSASSKKARLISSATEGQAAAPGSILVCDSQTFFSSKMYSGKQLSVLVFGDVSADVASRIVDLKADQLILEDRADRALNPTLRATASEIIPATSFAYTSTDFFIKRGRS